MFFQRGLNKFKHNCKSYFQSFIYIKISKQSTRANLPPTVCSWSTVLDISYGQEKMHPLLVRCIYCKTNWSHICDRVWLQKRFTTYRRCALTRKHVYPLFQLSTWFGANTCHTFLNMNMLLLRDRMRDTCTVQHHDRLSFYLLSYN